MIAREESHKGISPTFLKSEKPQAFAFVSRTNDNRKGNNSNWNNNNVTNGDMGNYNTLLFKNYGLKGCIVDRCFEIIGYPHSFKRNPNLKPASNFTNDRNNDCDARAGTLMGILNGYTYGGYALPVTHPPSNDGLLSVYKLIKDNNLSVGFDETKCFIQDLKKERILRTGSEFGGSYVFDKECNKSTVSNQRCKDCGSDSNDDEVVPKVDESIESFLGGMMVSLIFLEGLEEEALGRSHGSRSIKRIVVKMMKIMRTNDLDTYDFDCDDISNAKAILMANISDYGSDIISEVKDRQEKDKIGSKPDKNGKRGEAGKSQKQSLSREQEKLKKMQNKWPKMHTPTKL
nr:ribonuclease H-like domain-containing protein [Tanacetum cinerariifolium]